MSDNNLNQWYLMNQLIYSRSPQGKEVQSNNYPKKQPLTVILTINKISHWKIQRREYIIRCVYSLKGRENTNITKLISPIETNR
jgi:hypothetical protein